MCGFQMKSIEDTVKSGCDLIIFLTNNIIQIRNLCCDICEDKDRALKVKEMLPYIELTMTKLLEDEKLIYQKCRLLRKLIKSHNDCNKQYLNYIKTTQYNTNGQIVKSKLLLKVVYDKTIINNIEVINIEQKSAVIF